MKGASWLVAGGTVAGLVAAVARDEEAAEDLLRRRAAGMLAAVGPRAFAHLATLLEGHDHSTRLVVLSSLSLSHR